MRIADDTPFAPRRPASSPDAGDHGNSLTGFGQILARWDGLEVARSQEAAAIRPEIGSKGKAFIERPLVVLSAVTGTGKAVEQSPTASHRSASDFLEAGRLPPPNPIGKFLNALNSWAESQLQPSGELAPEASRFSLITQAGFTPGRQGASRSDRAFPSVAQRVANGQLMKLAQTQLAPTRQNSPRPAARGAEGASPYSAILIASDTGLRLVIRTPGLAPAEREELEARIAEVFAKRGIAIPQLHIFQPQAAGTGGRD